MSNLEKAGFSKEGLVRLDEVLKRQYVDSKAIPGYLIKIYRKGELVHTSHAGLMDIERNRPVQDDAIFRIYSMTKPITAVAAMMLVEECKLRLDDDVRNYIPEFGKLRVYQGEVPSLFPLDTPIYATTPLERPMKVIDLLTHTSGLTYYFMNRTRVDLAHAKQKIFLDLDDPGGMAAVIERLAQIPLEFSPGTKWNYSVGIDVVGHIIERITGMRLSDFMRKRIFGPLGMKDTDFFCPPEKGDRLCSNYLPLPSGDLALIDDAQGSPYLRLRGLDMGGGGAVSTGSDYLRFCRMMLGGGSLDGVRILSPKTVELFSQNFLPGGKTIIDLNVNKGIFTNASWNMGMSLACAVTTDTALRRLPGTVGSYSWGGAAGTLFWIDPREDLATVFMTQAFGTEMTNLRQDLVTLVYSAFTR